MNPDFRSMQLGDTLSPDHFSPGSHLMNGVEVFSPWAEQPVDGQWLRFERQALGAPWVLVRRQSGFYILIETESQQATAKDELGRTHVAPEP
jgi:hypothetical protein